MILILATTLFLLLSALVIGQAILRGLGARTATWLAPALGLCAMMLIASVAGLVPGRAVTTFVALALVTAGCAWVVVRDRSLWPDATGLLASLPLLALVMTPFAAAGWGGILGVSFNNDMANHLAQVEGLLPSAQPGLQVWDALGYPIGPHSLVASITAGTGMSSALAFSGFSVALPVILGWTALAALRAPARWAPFPVMIIAGFPFMVAAYYAQGAFKENIMAILAMAAMVLLARPPAVARIARWMPFALLVAGALTAYSYPGLLLPTLFLGAWAVVRLGLRFWRTRAAAAVARAVRTNVLPALIGLATLVVLVAPQAPRINRFARWEGIPADNIGNLAGPLPFREVLGVWSQSDFRVTGAGSPWVALGTATIGLAVIYGATWALRRGYWMTVLAPLLAIAVWAWAERTQSPYFAAKILAVLAPLIMLLAIRPFVEQLGAASTQRRLGWRPLVATALVAIELVSTVNILRASPVGPLEQSNEVQEIAATIGLRPVLYLGNDDFTPWLFRGTLAQSPVVGYPTMPFRSTKPFEYGSAYDIDSIDPKTLNGFDFVVTPRDAAASEMPSAFKLVNRSKTLDVYERTGRVAARAILPEERGASAGAQLNCTTAQGERILADGGVAAILPQKVTALGGPPIASGQSTTSDLYLKPGDWRLVVAYVSPRPIIVEAPGLKVTLPPYLGRPGPRWPLGRVTVSHPGLLRVRFATTSTWLSPPTNAGGSALTYVIAVTAVHQGGDTVVPIRNACGHVVDWYMPERRPA